jgi:hypothetical protein
MVALRAPEFAASSAQAPEHFLRSAQRRGDPPARRMLDIVDVLAQFFVPRSSRPAIGICEQSNGASNVET